MQFKAKQYFNLKCKEFRNDFVDVNLNGLLSRLIQTMLDIMSIVWSVLLKIAMNYDTLIAPCMTSSYLSLSFSTTTTLNSMVENLRCPLAIALWGYE